MRGVDEGWRSWRVIPRVVAGAVSVPVVVGFVTLGAAVLLGRSLREVAREAWALVPLRRSSAPSIEHRDSDAA